MKGKCKVQPLERDSARLAHASGCTAGEHPGQGTHTALQHRFSSTGPDLALVLVFLLCLERAYLCQMDAKQLKALCLSSLERKRLKGDFTALYSFLRRESGEGLLISSPWDSVTGHVGILQSYIRRGSDWT